MWIYTKAEIVQVRLLFAHKSLAVKEGFKSESISASQFTYYVIFSEFKSRSPTLSEDSGKHSGGSLQDNLNPSLLLATVRLRRRAGEPLGIVLASGM